MSHSFRFDRFELRPSERLLYQDGQAASLGARAVDVLHTLIKRPGQLVSKAELMDRVWPGLVVEENNLQVQISALRKVVGAQTIATVPGRGYRFMGQLLDAPGMAGAMGAGRSAMTAMGQADADVLSVLPTQQGKLWGRETDLRGLDELRPAALMTLVGPAGIGKTSFALAAAHAWRQAYPDGAAWVELAGLTDPDLVVTAVAQSLGLTSGSADPLGSLAAALRPLKLLLVLDNAEHVLSAVARLVQALGKGAPWVQVLVTSQLPLKVDGERVFRLGPLSVPDVGVSAQEAMRHGAVALFVDQVQAVDRHFVLTDEQVSLVVGLCQRLDGVPLAIKLAAARVPLLGLQGIQTRLDERFKLLSSHRSVAPARQQTLMGALDWSHELLSNTERAVFRRLSVFAGGFSLALAPQVAQDVQLDEWAVLDTLGGLVDRSLVHAEGEDTPRYRLLDSMRDYAVLKLADAGEQAETLRRHAQAVTRLMDESYETYWSQSDRVWLSTYGPEIDNVRVALEWALNHDKAMAMRLLGAAGPLFLLLGLAPECRVRGQGLQALANSPEPGPAVSRFWLERSRLHWGVANNLMHDFALRAATSYRAADDQRGLYLALRCLAGSGMLQPSQALGVLDEMARLEKPDWPTRLSAQRLLAEVTVLRSLERMADARRVCQHLLVMAQSAGLDGVVSASLSDLAAINMSLGDTDSAMKISQDILARGRHRRDNFVLHALAIVACVSFVKADLARARGAVVDFLAASRSRDWEWLGLYASLLALMAALEGRHDAAARLLGYGEQSYSQQGVRNVLTVYAWTRAHSLVQDALDSAVMARLKEQGAKLDPESVCAWALGTSAG